jgi:hypothetical protein
MQAWQTDRLLRRRVRDRMPDRFEERADDVVGQENGRTGR